MSGNNYAKFTDIYIIKAGIAPMVFRLDSPKGEDMKVRDIIAKKGSNVHTGPDSLSVKDVLDILTKNKVGALLIVDDLGCPVGIITEKDILRLANEHKNWHDLNVGDSMTRNLVVGLPDDDVEYIMSLMTINRFRHVPIMSDGDLAGIVSIGDIVKAQLKHIKAENRYLSDYIMGKYPA
jgi:CBS domain-containing protein